MPFCPAQAHASLLSVEQSERNHSPCHQSDEQSVNSASLIMTVDCLGLDLAYTGNHSAENILDGFDVDFFPIVSALDVYGLPTQSVSIRGPPFKKSALYPNHSDIYLTTQRLRI